MDLMVFLVFLDKGVNQEKEGKQDLRVTLERKVKKGILVKLAYLEKRGDEVKRAPEGPRVTKERQIMNWFQKVKKVNLVLQDLQVPQGLRDLQVPQESQGSAKPNPRVRRSTTPNAQGKHVVFQMMILWWGKQKERAISISAENPTT